MRCNSPRCCVLGTSRRPSVYHRRMPRCDGRSMSTCGWRTRAQQQILIRHALEGVFPEVRRACRAGVQSEAVRSVLRTGLTPRQIAALSEAEFVERVRAHFHGKRLFCGKLRALYSACQETVGSTLGSEAAMAEIRRCLAKFDHLEAQLAEVDAELDAALVLI